MTRADRRDLAFGALLLFALAAFGLAAGAPEWVRAGLVLGCALIVATHVVGSDEVTRSLAASAGATAFAIATIAAMVAPLLGLSTVLAEHARLLWAGLLALYLISWTALRIRRG